MTLTLWDQSLTPASGCLCLWQGIGRCSAPGRRGPGLSEEPSKLYRSLSKPWEDFIFLQVPGREAKPRQQPFQTLQSEVKQNIPYTFTPLTRRNNSVTSFLGWPWQSLGHIHTTLEKLNEVRLKEAWGMATPWWQPWQWRSMSLGDPAAWEELGGDYQIFSTDCRT